MASTTAQQPWFLNLHHPVLFPSHDALTIPQAEFDSFIAKEISRRHDSPVQNEAATHAPRPAKTETEESETFTLLSDSTSAEVRKDLAALKVDNQPDGASKENLVNVAPSSGNPFMDALHGRDQDEQREREAPDLKNKMLTTNGALAHQSTLSDLVDLFFELEDTITGPRLQDLLQSAWAVDPESTLKIIFNARSIHLGKSSKHTFYRCAGWLAGQHPLTLISNLRWLTRPVIEKKVTKKEEGDEDVVLVEAEKDGNDPARFDIKYGVAHGYWKDPLNILALAINGKLRVLATPKDVLNVKRFGQDPYVNKYRAAVEEESSSSDGDETQFKGTSKGRKKTSVDSRKVRDFKRKTRHERAVNAFNVNPVYRALHMTVARLFAEQLIKDLAALRGNDEKAKRTISLCGKWTPSHDRFHDRHTFIVSSIAEIMHPRESLSASLRDSDSRETYLRHARDAYRKDMSALRKHLDVVERDITANAFAQIKYERVPSLAMSNYSKLFMRKDFEHFSSYVMAVAEGKAAISGAVLLPSHMVSKARHLRDSFGRGLSDEKLAALSPSALLRHKKTQTEVNVLEGQWKALVERIKDSGTLSSSIAVCDVSGSMLGPKFGDGTSPIDSAIGLSLLISEVTEAPFGDSIITFSSNPMVHKLDATQTFVAKVDNVSRAAWNMNTNFVAVFEKLLLPMAKEHRLTNEDMVKRIFVFSDMQFDSAEVSGQTMVYDHARRIHTPAPDFRTSYERIKKKFNSHGYDMPQLIFWNLASGYSRYGGGMAPKPVVATEEGTSLVSGYSQGMVKLFLDNGGFDDAAEEEDSDDEMIVTKHEDGGATAERAAKKAKMDPARTVKKAVKHKAYDMLRVMD